MYHGVTGAVAREDFSLLLTFENGEHRILDMRPYLTLGVFKKLATLERFVRVRIAFDTVAWDGNIDLDPEFLYSRSVPVAQE